MSSLTVQLKRDEKPVALHDFRLPASPMKSNLQRNGSPKANGRANKPFTRSQLRQIKGVHFASDQMRSPSESPVFSKSENSQFQEETPGPSSSNKNALNGPVFESKVEALKAREAMTAARKARQKQRELDAASLLELAKDASHLKMDMLSSNSSNPSKPSKSSKIYGNAIQSGRGANNDSGSNLSKLRTLGMVDRESNMKGLGLTLSSQRASVGSTPNKSLQEKARASSNSLVEKNMDETIDHKLENDGETDENTEDVSEKYTVENEEDLESIVRFTERLDRRSVLLKQFQSQLAACQESFGEMEKGMLENTNDNDGFGENQWGNHSGSKDALWEAWQECMTRWHELQMTINLQQDQELSTNQAAKVQEKCSNMHQRFLQLKMQYTETKSKLQARVAATQSQRTEIKELQGLLQSRETQYENANTQLKKLKETSKSASRKDIVANGHSPAGMPNTPAVCAQETLIRAILTKGAVFIKHCQRGKSTFRQVWVSSDMNSILWRKPNQSCWRRKQTSMAANNISQIKAGIVTEIMAKCKNAEESQSFTISTDTRTIALQVPKGGNGLARDDWVQVFTWLLREQGGKQFDSRKASHNPIFAHPNLNNNPAWDKTPRGSVDTDDDIHCD